MSVVAAAQWLAHAGCQTHRTVCSAGETTAKKETQKPYLLRDKTASFLYASWAY